MVIELLVERRRTERIHICILLVVFTPVFNINIKEMPIAIRAKYLLFCHYCNFLTIMYSALIASLSNTPNSGKM